MAYSTINKSTDYFNTKLYTGNGGTQSITGVGHQPDWLWLKRRDSTGYHYLQDVVRGSQYGIYTNVSNAQADHGTGGVTSFNSDGFSIGNYNDINANSGTFVGWSWKAGGGQGSSNTDGSINTTYTSVSTAAGFSISQYIGTGANATVGHGLGAVPKMMIIKELNPATTRNWRVYHENIGNNKIFYFDLSNAETSDALAFNSTTPTSSVFSLGASAGTNGSGKNYVAYCFAENASKLFKINSYIGNGSTNGPFIYTGGKPVWFLVKRVNAANGWYLYDNKRPGYNLIANTLSTNTSAAEDTGSGYNAVDFVSNGVKIRQSNNDLNNSGSEYIYITINQPIIGQNNIPCTAS